MARTLLVVGDSLSAAYGMEREAGWVALLEQRLAERGPNYTVINASVSGDTTAGGRARLPRLLETYRPEVVVLQLGGNDGLRGLPLEQMARNLDEMIRLAKARAARVLLIGIRLPPNYGRAYTERFHAVYRDLAARHRLAFVPFLLEGVALAPGHMQADGIHPTAAAQPRILENVWPALREIL